MSEQKPYDEDSEFAQALGIYVGPATYDEVLEALTGMPPTSELIVRIETSDGVEWRQGWPEHYEVRSEDDDDERIDLFFLVRGRGSEGLSFGVMWREPSLVFYLHENSPRFRAERFTGGVRLRAPLATLTCVVWHSTLHVTESGDVAPGMGPFTVEIREEEE
jgi:hypothetical protein